MRLLGGRSVLLTALLSTAAPFAAVAQTQLLPEVVVSASRVPVLGAQVGSAVTVITAEELERRPERLVSEVLREVPGLAVNRTAGVGSFTQVRIRGAEANQTLVLIDGIEVNDVSNGSEFDFGNLLTTDIERIEVLRGPQSALWGSDAIGGVVNIITKRGQGRPRVTARLEGGSFDTGLAEAGVSGGGERYHFSVGGSYLVTDGISDADEDLGNPEEDGFENGTVRFKGGVRPLDNLEIGLVGFANRSHDDTDGAAVRDGVFIAVDDDSETRSTHRYGRAEAKLALLDGRWEHVVGAALTDDERDNFIAGMHDSLFDSRKVKYDYQTSFLFQTPAVARAEHTLTFAVEREEEEVFAQSAFTDVDREVDSTGLVGEYRLGLWDRLFLSGSLRHDDNDLFDDSDTYRATAAYLSKETGSRLHGSIGTGVKNPTMFELFGFAQNFVGNPNLVPEEATGWDAGVEQSLFGGRASIDVTYFQNEIENLIIGFGPTATNVAGASETSGVEVAGRVRLTETVDVGASYTYLRAEDADGAELVRRPRHTASVNVNYAFRLAGRPGNLNLGVDYVGARRDVAFDAAFVPFFVELEDYALVQLGASYEVRDGLDLFGRIENLLNEDYQEVFGFGTPGRAAYVGVRMRL